MVIIIQTLCKDSEEAKRIGRVLLEKKMASCVQIFPVQSTYWWEGKIVEEAETELIVKTLKQNYRAVSDEIQKNHSYKTPFIGALKLSEINGEYYRYMKTIVKKQYGRIKSRKKLSETDVKV